MRVGQHERAVRSVYDVELPHVDPDIPSAAAGDLIVFSGASAAALAWPMRRNRRWSIRASWSIAPVGDSGKRLFGLHPSSDPPEFGR